ncbi:2-dehydro-3-deoxygluconate kinase [Cutibacterium acnes JCM 18920]|nr:2-dehydro-3-deoxygluconate kinase [Cutibacterium acnes JCM 18920]
MLLRHRLPRRSNAATRPGERRIRTARSFDAWEGGGEYNVSRGLSRVFGKHAAVITSLVDDPVGRLVGDLITAGGVDDQFITWVPSDGVGRTVRTGLNFTERGFGVRGAVGVSDRGHTAASQLRAEDIDVDRLFGQLGVRCYIPEASTPPCHRPALRPRRLSWQRPTLTAPLSPTTSTTARACGS